MVKKSMQTKSWMHLQTESGSKGHRKEIEKNTCVIA